MVIAARGNCVLFFLSIKPTEPDTYNRQTVRHIVVKLVRQSPLTLVLLSIKQPYGHLTGLKADHESMLGATDERREELHTSRTRRLIIRQHRVLSQLLLSLMLPDFD